jgi:hypothetical protein
MPHLTRTPPANKALLSNTQLELLQERTLLPIKFRQAVSIARPASKSHVRNPLAIKRSENVEEGTGKPELPKAGQRPMHQAGRAGTAEITGWRFGTSWYYSAIMSEAENEFCLSRAALSKGARVENEIPINSIEA